MNAVTKHTESAATTPAPRGDNLLSIIQHVATDANFDVEKMQMLLKMRADEEERVRRIDREDRAEAAKRAWLSGFSKVQAEIGPIVRGQDNDHTRSKYADLADIERIVTPILTKNGFSTTCVPVPCEFQGCIRMRLTIGHEQGHEAIYEDDFPLDAAGSGGKVNKTPIQAKGSTQSYARRYLKASALDLAFFTDTDGNAPRPQIETITEAQFHEIRKLIEQAEVDETVVLTAAKVSALELLKSADFTPVCNRLRKTIEKKAAGQ